MEVTGIAASVAVMQRSVQATDLQMTLLKKHLEIQIQGLLKVLEAASQASANPPHLGNLIDTTA